MAKKFFEDRRPHQGMTYEEFFRKMAEKVTGSAPDSLPERERALWEYTRLNYQRSQRVSKTYHVSGELSELMARIDRPQLWMVLTEDWCGDSAQILPQIAKIADLSDRVDLRILPRDENPDIMDQYLTNGKRAVPKLVAFDEEGNELFRWGPRPAPAAQLVDEALHKGIPKKEIYPKLHAWYARDRGKTTDAEFVDKLRQVVTVPVVQ